MNRTFRENAGALGVVVVVVYWALTGKQSRPGPGKRAVDATARL